MELKKLMPGEVTQAQRDKHCMLSHRLEPTVNSFELYVQLERSVEARKLAAWGGAWIGCGRGDSRTQATEGERK